MTRKDYLLISDAIVATRKRISNDPKITDAVLQLRGVRRVTAHLADALKADHPAGFDAQLFLTNCGYGGTGPAYRPRDMDDAGQPVGED